MNKSPSLDVHSASRSRRTLTIIVLQHSCFLVHRVSNLKYKLAFADWGTNSMRMTSQAPRPRRTYSCGTEATVEYISGVIHGYKEGSFHARRPMDYQHYLLEKHPSTWNLRCEWDVKWTYCAVRGILICLWMTACNHILSSGKVSISSAFVTLLGWQIECSHTCGESSPSASSR